MKSQTMKKAFYAFAVLALLFPSTAFGLYAPSVETVSAPMEFAPLEIEPVEFVPIEVETVDNYSCAAEVYLYEEMDGMNEASIALSYLSSEDMDDVSYMIDAQVGTHEIFHSEGNSTVYTTDTSEWSVYFQESTDRKFLNIPYGFIQSETFPIYYGPELVLTAQMNGYDCTTKVVEVEKPLSCEVDANLNGDHVDLYLTVDADFYSSRSVMEDVHYVVYPYEEGARSSYSVQGGDLDIMDGSNRYYIGEFVYTDEHADTILFNVDIEAYDCGVAEVTVRESFDPVYYDALAEALMGLGVDGVVAYDPELGVMGFDEGDSGDAEEAAGEEAADAGEESEGGDAAEGDGGDAAEDEEGGDEGDEEEDDEDDEEVAEDDEPEITPELIAEILASPEAEGVDLEDREAVEALIDSYFIKLSSEDAANDAEASDAPILIYVLSALVIALVSVVATLLLKGKK